MSTVITLYRTWNGIPVETRTNVETGEIQLWTDSRTSSSSLKLASSKAGEPWTIIDKELLTRKYNAANGKSFTPDEVSREFLTIGYRLFDTDRAQVLNNLENYATDQFGLSQQLNFFNANVPLVTNPSTKQQVSSQGSQSTQQTITSIQQSQPQTASSAIQYGYDQQPVTSISENIDLNLSSVVGSSVLRYPLANLDVVGQELGIGYDYMKFKVVNHINSIDLGSGGFGGGDASSQYSQSAGGLATIILPMQSNLSSTNGVGWGQDSANILQLFAAGALNNYFGGIGGGQNVMDATKSLATELIQGAAAAGDIAISNKDAISSLLAGYVVGNNSIATRATGTVINPNMEMLFNGPQLRTFNFQFEMTPRFSGESQQIRNIIKTFKKYMSPSKTKGNAFLKTPKIFLLEYIYNGNGAAGNGNKHPYLNKFKPCALTSFNVNYTPDGSYMTYKDDGSMTKYSITMSFAEITPVYEDDYDDSSNDMGY